MKKTLKGVPELIFLSLITSMAASVDSGVQLTVVVGGLFPVQRSNPNTKEPCQSKVSVKGFQEAMAFKYAIDLINANSSYWNLKMEGVVLDTCDTESYALEQSRKFLKNNCRRGKLCTVVGASRSEVSIAVANLFSSYKVPQVSYASKSPKLDDVEKYHNFFRVVPSDTFIMKAILDILMKFGWNYVSMIFSEDEYGENAAQYLKELIRNTTRGICTAAVEILPKVPGHEDFSKAVQSLDKQENAKVVVVFLNKEMTWNLLSMCKELYIHHDRFIWIFSHRSSLKGYEHLDHTEGSITIYSRWYPIQGYDLFLFDHLNDNTSNRDPWIENLWKSQQCKWTSPDTFLRSNYTQDKNVPMVMDSVFLLASSIRNFCIKNQDLCNAQNNSNEKYKKITEVIARTKIKSVQEHNIIIRFDENRNVPVTYNIYQYRRRINPPYYKNILIGEWNQDKRLMIGEDPRWFTEEGDRIQGFPVSSSNETCRDFSCLDGQFPTFNITWSCVDQEVIFLGKNLKHPWAWVPLFLSVIGIMCTCGVFAIFFIYNQTPIIMASGRELCYFIFVGILVSYSFAFFILLQPTKMTCVIVRVSMSLGITVCYSAIFTKINRIYRIFQGPGVSPTCPWSRLGFGRSCITPKFQILICTCLISVQVMLSGLWLVVEPVTVYSTPLSEKERLVFCVIDDRSIMLGFGFNISLLVLCTVYGYKTRSIPENFNETKWISFLMYTSCIGWLSFILTYFSKLPDYRAQTMILAIGAVMSANATLVCIFFPKIYIVLFKPERNIRSRSLEQTAETTCGAEMATTAV